MAKKSLESLGRSVANLKNELRHELSEQVTELRESIDQRVSRIRTEVDEVLKELESRFGSDDKHVIFRQLPEPEPLTMGLTEVLSKRQSHRTFSDEPLSDQDLSTLLWAADGINRSNGRRTTPSALDWREIDIYILKANGIWRWVPEKHGLIFCELSDVRAETFFASPHLSIAPVHLIYVANRPRTDTFLSRLGERVMEKLQHDTWTPAKMDEIRTRSMIIDVGVKIQAVYMAAAAMNLACLARTGFDRDRVERVLRLQKGESVIAAQTLGYRLESILDTFR